MIRRWIRLWNVYSDSWLRNIIYLYLYLIADFPAKSKIKKKSFFLPLFWSGPVFIRPVFIRLTGESFQFIYNTIFLWQPPIHIIFPIILFNVVFIKLFDFSYNLLWKISLPKEFNGIPLPVFRSPFSTCVLAKVRVFGCANGYFSIPEGLFLIEKQSK